MNFADIGIIAIIGISVLVSIFRGFVREILSLVAWVAAFWVAAKFAVPASELLEPWLKMPTARIVLAFIGILIVTLLVAGVINYLIAKLLDKTGLSGTDRLLGAVFGLARGAAIVIIAVLGAGLTPITGEDWWAASPTLAPFETAAVHVVNWMPADLAKHFSF